MLKNILGSIVFTAAVFALVNFIGNAMVNPATAPHQPRPLKAAVQAQPQVQAQTETKAVAEAAPAPEATAPAAQPATQVAAMADDDDDAGKKLFRRKCMGCHTVDKDGANRTGPNLWNIIGKEKAIAEGYRYSTPMKALGGVWSAAEVAAFIARPRVFVPDTKMTFAGLKKEEDRANLVAYLNTLKD